MAEIEEVPAHKCFDNVLVRNVVGEAALLLTWLEAPKGSHTGFGMDLAIHGLKKAIKEIAEEWDIA